MGVKQGCLIFDVAVIGNQDIIMKEKRKEDKYGDLRIKFAKYYPNCHRSIVLNINQSEKKTSVNLRDTLH